MRLIGIFLVVAFLLAGLLFGYMALKKPGPSPGDKGDEYLLEQDDKGEDDSEGLVIPEDPGPGEGDGDPDAERPLLPVEDRELPRRIEIARKNVSVALEMLEQGRYFEAHEAIHNAFAFRNLPDEILAEVDSALWRIDEYFFATRGLEKSPFVSTGDLARITLRGSGQSQVVKILDTTNDRISYRDRGGSSFTLMKYQIAQIDPLTEKEAKDILSENAAALLEKAIESKEPRSFGIAIAYAYETGLEEEFAAAMKRNLENNIGAGHYLYERDAKRILARAAYRLSRGSGPDSNIIQKYLEELQDDFKYGPYIGEFLEMLRPVVAIAEEIEAEDDSNPEPVVSEKPTPKEWYDKEKPKRFSDRPKRPAAKPDTVDPDSSPLEARTVEELIVMADKFFAEGEEHLRKSEPGKEGAEEENRRALACFKAANPYYSAAVQTVDITDTRLPEFQEKMRANRSNIFFCRKMLVE